MIALSDRAKDWFRKVLCTSLPPALTENTETEVVLKLEHSTLRLDVVYTSRTYRTFNMDHYITSITIDKSLSNLRKISMAGLDVDDFIDIPDYHYEGTYKGSRLYHLARYTNQIMDKIDL